MTGPSFHDIETPFGRPGFLVLAGSRLFGMDTPESDYDYVGAIVEPEAYRIGLKNYRQDGKDYQRGFEQHMFKGDNHEGSVYSVWKLASMLAEGNPTCLALMFANPIRDDYGICTPEFREMVISRKSGHRFMKYMEAQRKSMIGQRAKHVTRQELIRDHGFDTKFAAHLIRLGYQGVEFLTTGNITLPMPDESVVSGSRLNLLDIRAGEWSMKEVIDEAEALEARMQRALERTTLPEDADWERLSEWVTDTYFSEWLRMKFEEVRDRLRKS
jgi:predicted nucleotidyltransferase